MKKIIKSTHRQFVLEFWKIAKLKGMDDLHLIFELASLICGIQKSFDMTHPPEVFVNILTKFAQDNPSDFFVYRFSGDEEEIFLVNMKHKKLFNEFMSEMRIKNKKNYGKEGELYGKLMAFPETATKAWNMDAGRYDNDRVHLLNFYATVILNNVFKCYELFQFIYTNDNWQSEFKYRIRIEMTIIEQFPDVFPFTKKTEFRLVQEAHKALLKKRDLFKLLSPLQKALFIACQSDKISFDEKNILYSVSASCA